MRHILLILLMVTGQLFAQTRTMKLDADCVQIRDGICIDKNEFGYLEGATSNLQIQIHDIVNDVSTNDTAISDHVNDTDDAHDASAISSVPAGNLAADDVQEALDELQTDIDTRALGSDLTTHESDTTTHGTTGDIVGTSDTQTLTNKTIDADLSTITNIENADIKSGAAIDAAKIHDGSVSNTEFGYLDGATANIQIQIDSKETAITTLPVSKGGTGQSTLTSNNVILGNGTSGVQFVAPGTSGNVLKSNGSTWVSDVLTAGTNQLISTGATNPDIQAVYFGSGASCTSACSTGTCTICARVGTQITSVSYNGGTGLYLANGIDGTKYVCFGGGGGAAFESFVHVRTSSTSTTAYLIAGDASTAVNVAYATLICIGVP